MRPMRRNHVSVLVIGAGALGLAATRALAQRGVEVRCVEQAAVGHERSGSKGAARIFRLAYPDPGYVRLAAESRTRWAALEDECGEQLIITHPLVVCGPGAEAMGEAMDAAGAVSERLAEEEVHERWSGLRVDGLSVLDPAAGVIAADRALGAMATVVGDRMSMRCRARSLRDEGRRVVVILEDDDGPEHVECETVVVTAGPFTAGLLGRSGVTMPPAWASPSLQQVVHLASGESDAGVLPSVVRLGGKVAYGLPTPGSGTYKLGLHAPGPLVDPVAVELSVDADAVETLRATAAQLLPGLGEIVATERCFYDNTPDEDFVIDRIGNVVIGSGTSGHGFKFAPLIGETLSALAVGESPEWEWRRFAVRQVG